MPTSKILEILDHYEDQVTRDLELDRKIEADPYANAGKLRLIQNIRKDVSQTYPMNEEKV